MTLRTVPARRAGVRLLDSAERAVANRFVAYGLLVTLQLRVLWGIWSYGDLTSGDTSSYFRDAAAWAHGLHVDIVYYPLYDVAWGTILTVVHGVYAAMVLHRLLIVFGASVLFLALMRTAFPPAVALLAAIWWAIVPANFAPHYEVHLAGAIVYLIALLAVARMPRREGLGIALAILLAGSVLMRNETIIAAVLLGGVIVWHEVCERRTSRRPTRRDYLRSYGIPLAVSLALIGFAYARSEFKGSTAWTLLSEKEKVNFCESYANAFAQRFPSRFAGNPFSDCAVVTRHDFGRPYPTPFQALGENPRAVFGFAAWNVQLLPGGLQTSLFGATALPNNPGFAPARENSDYALVLSVLAAAIIAGALWVGLRGRLLSVSAMSARARWLAVTAGVVALDALIAALDTRPWSDYIYGLAIAAFLVVAVSVTLLVRYLGLKRLVAPAALTAAVALIAGISSYYSRAPRPIYDAVRHLQRVGARLAHHQSVLVAYANAYEACNYLARGSFDSCQPALWPIISAQAGARDTAGAILARARATAVYADGPMLADPRIARLLDAPRSEGWRVVARGSGSEGPWSVLVPA